MTVKRIEITLDQILDGLPDGEKIIGLIWRIKVIPNR